MTTDLGLLMDLELECHYEEGTFGTEVAGFSSFRIDTFVTVKLWMASEPHILDTFHFYTWGSLPYSDCPFCLRRACAFSCLEILEAYFNDKWLRDFSRFESFSGWVLTSSWKVLDSPWAKSHPITSLSGPTNEVLLVPVIRKWYLILASKSRPWRRRNLSVAALILVTGALTDSIPNQYCNAFKFMSRK